jgi:cytosine/adenosine deaminase-related metal-dependent hydrolase
VRDVLEFATLAGARTAGLGRRTGSLSPGKQADLILVRAHDINLAPVTDPAAAVVLAAHPGNVDTVLVGGRTVKRGGRLVAADLPGVLALAEVSRRRVLATIAEQRGA